MNDLPSTPLSCVPLVPIYERRTERSLAWWVFTASLAAAAFSVVVVIASEEPAPIRAVAPATEAKPSASGRAWRWLESMQNKDGSFGTGRVETRAVTTSLVVGLVAAADPRDSAAVAMLDRGVAWLVATQEIVAPETGSAPVVALSVLALAAERDRRLGRLDPRRTYVEAIEQQLSASDPGPWEGALLARALAPWSQAEAALEGGDPRAAACLRANFFRAQFADGHWGPDGNAGIVETACTLRALHSLPISGSRDP